MSQLTTVNYLNLVGYIFNAFFTFFAAPIFGFPSNGELSDKYQTIVTPNGLTFSIWGIIFISQAIFAIVQMIPKYRDTKLVQEGVSYWYFVGAYVEQIRTFKKDLVTNLDTNFHLISSNITAANLQRVYSKLYGHLHSDMKSFSFLSFAWPASLFPLLLSL